MWPGARREVLPHGHPGASPGSGAVTDEQRSPRPNSAQPSGRRFFSAPAALLAPYRSAWDMLVARALPGPKTPRRKRHRIYAHDHLAGRHAADGDRPRSGAFSRCARRQGRLRIGARTAMSARSWLQIEFARTWLSALLSSLPEGEPKAPRAYTWKKISRFCLTPAQSNH